MVPGARPGRPSAADLAALRQLHTDGGWTPEEAQCALSTVPALTAEGLILTLHTAMGPLIVLTQAGLAALFGSRAPLPNATKAVDRAYFRLCLRDLGWTLGRAAHAGRAQDAQRIERYPLVHTPVGTGYVIARLSGNGCSLSAMRESLDWLRGRLLYERRYLIVLTPSRVRGRRFAAQNPHTLRLITHLPRTVPETRGGTRLRGGTPQGARWGDPARPEGPVVTAENRREYRARGLSDLTLAVLSGRRAERIEWARAALETDLVLSGQQLARHYGLCPEDLEEVPFVEDLVVPVHGHARGERLVRFYLNSSALARRRATQLAHLAGTAELRHQLSVPPGEWTVVQRSRPESREPDAYYNGAEDAHVAVEYDSGAYSALKVWRKAGAFEDRGFDHIVWGVPSARRAQRLHHELNLDVRVVRWFE